MTRNTLSKDLRHGARVLARNRGFAAVALLTLAIGIGASAAIFSFVDAVLLRPLPYASADRIVRVLETRPSGETTPVSTPDFLDWQAASTSLEQLAAQQTGLVTLAGAEPVPLRVARVTANFFDVFGVKAALGRTFVAGEDRPGNEHVVILSHALWQSQFGGDLSIVDRAIVLDGAPFVVVGVLGADSGFDRGAAQLWHPLVLQPAAQTRSYRWLSSTFGLLAPGTSLEQARSQLTAIGARLADAYPDTNKGWGVAVDSYADAIVGANLKTALWVLLAAVGGLLLICCANLANLVLARAVARDTEVAVRASLGATRGRIVQQFLCENLVLAAGGSLLGLALAWGAIEAFRRLLPPGTLPSEAVVRLDWRVVAFAAAMSVVTAGLFGLAPIARAVGADALRAGRRSVTPNRRSRRWLDGVVVAEVTVSVVLLSSAALLIRSFVGLTGLDTGFDAQNVLTMRLPVPGFPPGSRYSSPDEFKAYVRQIQGAVEAVPGVRAVALTNALPLGDCCMNGLSLAVEGRTTGDPANRGGGYYKVVTPSYFRTLGLRLARGRFLDDGDNSAGRRVAVINERVAARYFAGGDPIGKRLLTPEILPGRTDRGPDVAWEIVGVVHDEKITSLADDDSAVLYVSYEQGPAYFMSLAVSGLTDAASLEPAVRRALHTVSAEQAVLDVRTLERIESASVGSNRFQTALLGAFSLVALVLASVGIFGVLAHSVVRRSRELGIRAALGASRADLLKRVLRQGVTLTAAGIGLGLIAAYAAAPLLSPLLYRTNPHDGVLLAAVSAVFLAVGICASAAPAYRAARMDPNVVLRGE